MASIVIESLTSACWQWPLMSPWIEAKWHVIESGNELYDSMIFIFSSYSIDHEKTLILGIFLQKNTASFNIYNSLMSRIGNRKSDKASNPIASTSYGMRKTGLIVEIGDPAGKWSVSSS